MLHRWHAKIEGASPDADLAGAFGAASPGGNPGAAGGWFLMKLGANASKIATWAAKDKGRAWLHGYWEFDWADSYRKLDQVVPITLNGTQYMNVSFVPNGGSEAVGLQVVKTHARFYGVNLLSELDQPGAEPAASTGFAGGAFGLSLREGDAAALNAVGGRQASTSSTSRSCSSTSSRPAGRSATNRRCSRSTPRPWWPSLLGPTMCSSSA